MKKILFATLAIVLSFSVSACGSPSPSDVVTDYLDAIKAQDTDTIERVYAGNADDVSINSDDDGDDNDDAFSEGLQDKINDMFTSFEYSVSNEKIDGDAATVDVSIKTYDFASAFQTAIGETFTEVLGMAFSGASDEEIENATNDIFAKKLDEAAFDFEKTVTISLTKSGSGWIIDSFDEDSPFIDAVTGGLTAYANDLQDSFDDFDLTDDDFDFTDNDLDFTEE